MGIRIMKHSLTFFGVTAVVAASLVALPGTALALTVVDLGTLPGGISNFPADINAVGMAAGTVGTTDGTTHAV
jgi:hypothetical protein